MTQVFGNSVKTEGVNTMRGHGLRRWPALAVLVLFLGGSAPIFGHQKHDHADPDQSAAARQKQDQTARAGGGARWGANYFPNVTLVTQDGKSVRFFDDLLKDKVVVIYFMYTSCEDTCPLETAQLVRVQRILGDRVGKDVFMYSITIDPKHDTPEVL